MTTDRTLAERVAAEHWYHTIDLGRGGVTKGFVDNRAVARKLPIPASLAGRRCLDIGTHNGFWAFEMERRGASAVIGLDIEQAADLDWPARLALTDPGGGYLERELRATSLKAFLVAKEALESNVEREWSSVYDLDPERHGTFDFVFLGSLLLHLRDPVQALTRAREVCSGEMVVFDAVDPWMTLLHRRPAAGLDGRRAWWWQVNSAGLIRMAEAAGFDVVERTKILSVRPGAGFPARKLTPRSLFPLRTSALWSVVGHPHVALRLRPLD